MTLTKNKKKLIALVVFLGVVGIAFWSNGSIAVTWFIAGALIGMGFIQIVGKK